MRLGTMWRCVAFAAAVLLTSSQMCMLTTCVPRLQHASAAGAHACCHAAPAPEAPASPAPMGAMPCDESMNLAGAPTLDVPAPAAMPVALAAEVVTAPAEHEAIALDAIERDTGPSPRRHTAVPTGLRAPPRA